LECFEWYSRSTGMDVGFVHVESIKSLQHVVPNLRRRRSGPHGDSQFIVNRYARSLRTVYDLRDDVVDVESER